MKYITLNVLLALIVITPFVCLKGQTTTMNFISSTDVINATISDHSQLNNLPNNAVRKTIRYYDGVGRPGQDVIVDKSPAMNSIVQHIAYDRFGRSPQNFLPFTTASGSDYVANAGSAQAAYYQNPPQGVPSTAYPFSEKAFEPSPLNRVISEAPQGETWAFGSGNRPISFSQGANLVSDAVYYLSVDAHGTIHSLGFYPEGVLFKSSTTDENGNSVFEFKDMQGKQILSRRIVTGQDGSAEFVDTYYAYDAMQLLRRVIMPEARIHMVPFTDYNHTFGYMYDERKRLVEKTIPGSETVYLVYDKLDRLRFEQDGNMRRYDIWKTIKYDALNRPVLEGTYQQRISRNALQEALYSSNLSNYEVENNSEFGYTNNLSFPSKFFIALTSYYYDNYDFNRNGNSQFSTYFLPNFSDAALSQVKGQLTAMRTISDLHHHPLFEVYFYDNKYRTVQSMIENREANTIWRTGNYYNFGGVLLGVNKKLTNRAGEDIINYTFVYEYDHDWRMTESKLILNNTTTSLVQNTYSETGALLDKQLHTVGNTHLYNLRHDYNIRGWLLGVNSLSSAGNGLIHGFKLYYDGMPTAKTHWQAQFNGNISAMEYYTEQLTADRGKISGYLYSYDELNRLKSALFYRHLNTEVSYLLPESADPRHNYGKVTGIGTVANITYDKNGNIRGLTRYARNGNAHFKFDDLSYYYQHNRLIAVDDDVTGQNDLSDFHDNGVKYQSHALDEFRYDANGNMTSDLNRNLRLQYGLIHNMPVSISFNQVGGGGGGGEVEVAYSLQDMLQVKAKYETKATTYSGNILNHYTWQGRKLGKKVYSDQGTLTLDEAYYGELTLSFGQPSRILHADGYVDVSGQMPVFYYHLKDHLGNVRSVITPGTDNQPEIVQAMEYFPFGMSFESSIPNESEQSHMPNKHKYNSKEEQEMPGRWLDYGFRFYDAQIARFHSVDPLAHSFPDQSPYVYAVNNPISFIDFMGLSAMSDISTRRASSFTLEMNNEQWMNATRPAGIAGVESNEKTKKTDKKTESQTGQQSTNGKKKKDGIGKVAQGGGGGSYQEQTFSQSGYNNSWTSAEGVGAAGGFFYSLNGRVLKDARGKWYVYASSAAWAPAAEKQALSITYYSTITVLENGKALDTHRGNLRVWDSGILRIGQENFTYIGDGYMPLPITGNNISVEISITYNMYQFWNGHAFPKTPFVYRINF